MPIFTIKASETVFYQEEIQAETRDEAIKHIRDHQKTIESNGSCLNCQSPSTKRFCDIDCRNDYEKRYVRPI